MVLVVQPPIALRAHRVLVRLRDKGVAAEPTRRREAERSPWAAAHAVALPKVAPRSAVQPVESRLKPLAAIRLFAEQGGSVRPMVRTALSRRAAELASKQLRVDKQSGAAVYEAPPTGPIRQFAQVAPLELAMQPVTAPLLLAVAMRTLQAIVRAERSALDRINGAIPPSMLEPVMAWVERDKLLPKPPCVVQPVTSSVVVAARASSMASLLAVAHTRLSTGTLPVGAISHLHITVAILAPGSLVNGPL
jgi:hypothetical protein